MPITSEIIFLFLTVIGGIGGLWWRIEARLSMQDAARDVLQRELADYKLFVAQNHVSSAALRESEQRLIGAIEKLGNQLEEAVRQLNALSRNLPRP
jgi:chromosome segregation ATPase